jgi:hypothetical protein
VEVTKLEHGIISGNIYELDIQKYAENVKAAAVISNAKQIFFDDVRRNDKYEIMPLDEFNRRYPLDLPKMAYWRNLPADTEALNTAVEKAWDMRLSGTVKCDIWRHTDNLHDRRLLFHADKLIKGINGHKEPNSADKQSFTTALDAYVANNFGTEQLSSLLDKLPYKNAAFVVQKGQRWDMKLVVPKNEVLQLRQEQSKTEKTDKVNRPVKPSVLAALEANEQKVKQQFANKVPGIDANKKGRNGLGD